MPNLCYDKSQRLRHVQPECKGVCKILIMNLSVASLFLQALYQRYVVALK